MMHRSHFALEGVATRDSISAPEITRRRPSWLCLLAGIAVCIVGLAGCLTEEEDGTEVGEVEQEIGWPEKEVSFNAGVSNGQYHWMEELSVCGRNQYNQYVCYYKSWAPSNANSWTVTNWWWKMDQGVVFSFKLLGYGWRSCTVYYNPWWAQRIDVRYEGNYVCSASGW